MRILAPRRSREQDAALLHGEEGAVQQVHQQHRPGLRRVGRALQEPGLAHAAGPRAGPDQAARAQAALRGARRPRYAPATCARWSRRPDARVPCGQQDVPFRRPGRTPFASAAPQPRRAGGRRLGRRSPFADCTRRSSLIFISAQFPSAGVSRICRMHFSQRFIGPTRGALNLEQSTRIRCCSH